MAPEANKEVVRIHFAALNTGDPEAFAATHDPAGRNHAPAPFDLSEWPAEGKPFGPAEARQTFGYLRGSMPDLHVDIEDLIAEGDEVVAWIRMTGTQSGSGGPVPAPGRAVDFHHAQRFRIRDGLIVEHWAVRDDLRAMLQGGVVAMPGRPSA